MRQAGVPKEVLVQLAALGFVVVPFIAADDFLLAARDDDGALIFAGGVEHYFRNDAEACWYGRQVWRGLLRSLMDSRIV